MQAFTRPDESCFFRTFKSGNNYEALAYETVCSEVTMGENPWKSTDFKIMVAHREQVSDLVTV